MYDVRAMWRLVVLASGVFLLATPCCGEFPCLSGECPDDGPGGWVPPADESLGEFRLFYYWQAKEDDHGGEAEVPLHDESGEVVATVAQGFADELTLEGTGLLEDGRIIGLHGPCTFAETGWCYRISNPATDPYGEGAWGALAPFRSASLATVWDLRGTPLYVPALKGVMVPTADGKLVPHDGCLIANDYGWSLSKQDIDFYILHEGYHQAIIDQLPWDHRAEVFANPSQCPSRGDALSLFFPF